MTATGAQFRDECERLGIGKQYNSDPALRFGPNAFDCSGLMVVAARTFGLAIPTASWSQARWCHLAGLDRLPIKTALATPGALLFHGPNFGYDGFGNDGHVACSMGDGRHTMEAHSAHTTPEVGIFDTLNDPWTNAARIPGLDYGSGAGTIPTMIEGNPMYAIDQVCGYYADGHGHAWALFPSGAVDTIYGGVFYGSYLSLRDAHDKPLEARTDFGHIGPRLDGKPGYTLLPINWKPGQLGYSFPVGA